MEVTNNKGDMRSRWVDNYKMDLREISVELVKMTR